MERDRLDSVLVMTKKSGCGSEGRGTYVEEETGTMLSGVLVCMWGHVRVHGA